MIKLCDTRALVLSCKSLLTRTCLWRPPVNVWLSTLRYYTFFVTRKSTINSSNTIAPSFHVPHSKQMSMTNKQASKQTNKQTLLIMVRVIHQSNADFNLYPFMQGSPMRCWQKWKDNVVSYIRGGMVGDYWFNTYKQLDWSGLGWRRGLGEWLIDKSLRFGNKLVSVLK